MNDGRPVRADQTGDDAACDAQRAGERELLLAIEGRREIRSLDEGHRDVFDTLDLAEIVNADDVWMRDLPREQQLALEPALDLLRARRVGGDLGTNHFDRDVDAQFRIPRLIHRA